MRRTNSKYRGPNNPTTSDNGTETLYLRRRLLFVLYPFSSSLFRRWVGWVSLRGLGEKEWEGILSRRPLFLSHQRSSPRPLVFGRYWKLILLTLRRWDRGPSLQQRKRICLSDPPREFDFLCIYFFASPSALCSFCSSASLTLSSAF